jgi:hypothetical protein
MAPRTRATPQVTAPHVPDEDEVDYGEGDTELTDISELERQLNEANPEEPPSAQPPQVQVSATPQAAPAEAAATTEATVTLPATLVASMTNSLNAFATHLDRLTGSHGPATQGTHPLPPPPPENPLVHTIRGRWPAVDPAHLQEILENRFKVENLMKLNASFVYTPDRRLENITLGSVEIPTTSRNVQIHEYQEITQLLKPLAVYADILHEFAPPDIRDRLSSAMLKYMHHLMDINERCTWHSVRLYHFSFHRKRVLMGVHNCEGWMQFSDPELNHLLIARSAPPGKRSADSYAPGGPPAKRSRAAASSSSDSSARSAQRISEACRRHNRGSCSSGPQCRFKHICWTCGDAAHTASACPQAQQAPQASQ